MQVSFGAKQYYNQTNIRTSHQIQNRAKIPTNLSFKGDNELDVEEPKKSKKKAVIIALTLATIAVAAIFAIKKGKTSKLADAAQNAKGQLQKTAGDASKQIVNSSGMAVEEGAANLAEQSKPLLETTQKQIGKVHEAVKESVEHITIGKKAPDRILYKENDILVRMTTSKKDKEGIKRIIDSISKDEGKKLLKGRSGTLVTELDKPVESGGITYTKAVYTWAKKQLTYELIP